MNDNTAAYTKGMVELGFMTADEARHEMWRCAEAKKLARKRRGLDNALGLFGFLCFLVVLGIALAKCLL